MAKRAKQTDWWKAPFEKGWYPLSSIAADWGDKTVEEAKSIQRILGLKKGARILDIGCGVGRHSIALAKLGYEVTGVDISDQYLRVARSNANQRKVSAKFFRCDMRKLPFKDEFDGAINLFSSFGYFRNQSDDMKVLRGIFRSLSPKGVFLIDNMNFDFVKENFLAQSWSELGDGTLILEKRDPPDLKNRILRSHWLFVAPNGKRSEMRSSIRGYSRNDLSRCLRKAGFVSIRSHVPLGRQVASLKTSPRIVLSVKKPA